MTDLNWKEEGISSHKLDYIAYKYNFFFEGHRAIIDCLAGIHILAQDLPKSNLSVLKQLLINAIIKCIVVLIPRYDIIFLNLSS